MGMHLTHRNVHLVLAAGVITALGLSAWSAPILPEPKGLTDQVRSLAGLKRLHVHVQPFSADLLREGLAAEAIGRDWANKLRNAGFEVTEEATARLELRLAVLEDPEHRGNFVVNPVLMLHRQVRFGGDRIEGPLKVPTYVGIEIGIVQRGGIVEPLRDVLQAMLEHFLENWRHANRS